MKTIGTYFSGGGLADVGALEADYKPVFAVEYDPANVKQSMRIADCYERNLGKHVIRKPVQDVDPAELPWVDWFHASPVCKNASVAKADGGEDNVDLVTAQAVIDYIDYHKPTHVSVENVQGYAKFEAYQNILKCLNRNGYDFKIGVLNAADYGVPQTRIRLFIRATLGGRVKPLQPTHTKTPDPTPRLFGSPLKKWVGWYESVADIVHTFPNDQFAPWQVKKLKEAGFKFDKTHLASSHLVNNGRPAEMPAHTMVSSDHQAPMRAFVMNAANPNGNEKRKWRFENEPAKTMTAGGSGAIRAMVPAESFFVSGSSTADTRAGDEPALTVVSSMPNMGGQRVYLAEGRTAGDRPLQCRESSRPAMTVTTASGGNVYRYFLAHGGNASGFSPRVGTDPAKTISAGGGDNREVHRAYIGHVCRITPQGIARFMSLPNWYKLPEKPGDAVALLGNGVCSLLMQRIGEAWNI